MEIKKTGPSDGSDYYQKDDGTMDEKEESEKDKQFREEMEKLKKTEEEMEERKKEKLKQLKKREVKTSKEIREEEKIEIGGQKVEPKKIYTHERGKGIFIRGKSKNYQIKIRKALKKVRGVSLEKKRAFEDIVGECAKGKITVDEKEIDNIIAKFKHKTFTGSGSVGIKKMLENKKKGGVDIKKYKKELKTKFTRRDLDKFKRVIKGEEDPRKHRISPSSNRNPGAGRPGSTSPSRIKNR